MAQTVSTRLHLHLSLYQSYIFVSFKEARSSVPEIGYTGTAVEGSKHPRGDVQTLHALRVRVEKLVYVLSR